jgi:hypothetical protein
MRLIRSCSNLLVALLLFLVLCRQDCQRGFQALWSRTPPSSHELCRPTVPYGASLAVNFTSPSFNVRERESSQVATLS